MIWNCECGAPHSGGHPLDHPLPKKPDWSGITRLNHPSYPGPYSDLRDLGWVLDMYGHRETSGAYWHLDCETFIWVEDRWLGFGAKLTTCEERERDIRWKNQALNALGMVETSEPAGPGAGGNRGL